MSLTVETGAGLSNAESYLSVAGFKAYCDGRGMSYGTTSDTVLEQKLRIATQYVDTIGRFKGSRLQAAQALEFPRSGLVDWSGITVEGLPARVVQATAELAFKAISTDLLADQDRGGKVKSQSVGPISITYADDAPTQKVFAAATRLLEPYMRDPTTMGSPYFNSEAAEPSEFTRTLHDTSGLTSELE